jgi:hypothetical protein
VAWIIGFLGVTVVAVGAELWASFDGDPDTAPWTDLIVRYVTRGGHVRVDRCAGVVAAAALLAAVHAEAQDARSPTRSRILI